MANGYDPEVENRDATGSRSAAPFSDSTSGGNASFSTGDSLDPVRRAEQTGGRGSLSGNNTEGAPGGATDAASNSAGGATSSTHDRGSAVPGPDNLRDSEESANNPELTGFYNENGDRGRFGLRRNRTKVSGLRGRLRKKLILGGVAGGSVIIIILMLLFLFLVAGQKVIMFAEHVAAWEFARTTAQMAEDTANIDAEKVALESIPDTAAGNTLLGQLKARYTSATGKASDLWSKFDKYRPNKIIQNFGNDGRMSFDEGTTKLGTAYIKSMTLDGTTYDLEQRSLANSLKNTFIPGYKFVNRDVGFARNFAPDLVDALKADDIGPITRARVASQIRQELNISLTAWLTARYLGKKPLDVKTAIEQDGYNVAEEGSASAITSAGATASGAAASGSNGALNSAAQEAQAAESAQVSDAASVQKDILPDPNSLPSSVQDALASLKDSSMTLGGTLAGIVGFINPFYKIAVPLCLVYDGSLTQSGPSIDTQNAQLERSAVWIQSAAAQLKDGNTASGEAASAFDYKLGDITQSIAEQRANGENVDTSSFAATEASPTGQYSIADVGLPSPVSDVVDSLGSACPQLTNLWVGAAIGGVNITIMAVLALIPGAGEAGDAGIAGSEAAVETAANEAVPSLASRVIQRIVAGGSNLKDFGIKTVRDVGLIGGATLIAKSIVVSQIGASHNSLAVGQPYDDTVDSGTNLYANQINQRQFYGAPMPDYALQQDWTNNQKQLGLKQSRQSAFERYLAVSNPDSFVDHLAIMANGLFSRSGFSSLSRLGGLLLDPLRSIGSAFSPLFSHSALAAANVTSVNTYYGNVQFGYTSAEKALLDSCDLNNPKPRDCTYALPLENQRILDESGQEDAINAKFGKCFDGSESIGTMLANGDIQRDSSGNVIQDKGLCSPDNLSFDSPDLLAADSDSNSPEKRDMIFRWRLAHSYNNTLDQLSDMQQVTSADSGGTTPSTGPSDISAYKDPFRDIEKSGGLSATRVDEGVDYYGSGPVYAIGNGTVTKVANGSGSEWWGGYGGNSVVYKLTDGPAAGDSVYVAEHCPPSPNISTAPPHNQVTSDTVICTMQPASIETGWAVGDGTDTPIAHAVYQEGHATAYGQNFSDLMDALGVSKKACYDHPNESLEGSLPPNWPAWGKTNTTAGSNHC